MTNKKRLILFLRRKERGRMNIVSAIKSIKTSTYLSCGTDHDESGKAYCYLQTAHDKEEDVELLSARNMFPVVVVGRVLGLFFRKRLERW